MRKLISLAVAALLVAGSAVGAPVRSGPQVGDTVPGPFRPLHINGPNAGKRVCLYCKHGAKPVAMIFARELTPALANLFSKIDALSSSAAAEPGCFAVFLGDVEKWTPPLQQTATRCALKKLVLTVQGPSAPANYEIANDAAITVILYREHTVKANHSFRTGELDDKAVAAILAGFAKMLQEK